METPITLQQLDTLADVVGCYIEIDGDRMLAQLFCNISGDWLGTIKLN